MIKQLFLVLLISGCASNVGTTEPKYWTHPERIECPDDYVAYCEGRTRPTMECTCIEQREIQHLFEGLYR